MEHTVEEGFAILDELLEKLEDKNVSLEDAFKLYEQGVKEIASCQEKIDTTAKKVQMIQDKVAVPFEG